MEEQEVIFLHELKKHEQAEFMEIVENPEFGVLDAQVTHRLQDLGFIRGRSLEIIAYSFLGKDPIAVRMGNAQFALRKAEAKKIKVRRQQTSI